MTDETLDLISFGDEYLTAGTIELLTGSYALAKFIVLDAEGNAIYASPLQGSDKANLVSNPLPLAFEVTADATTTVVPEVLAVGEEESPSAFGYLGFGFVVVTPPQQSWKLQVYEKTSPVDSVPLEGAVLEVFKSTNYAKRYGLSGGVNSTPIPDGAAISFVVSKEGYATYLGFIAWNSYSGEIISVTLDKLYSVQFELNMAAFPEVTSGYVFVRSSTHSSSGAWEINGSSATSTAYLPSQAPSSYELVAFFNSTEEPDDQALALGRRIDYGSGTHTLSAGELYSLTGPDGAPGTLAMDWSIHTGNGSDGYTAIASTDPFCQPFYRLAFHSHYWYVMFDHGYVDEGGTPVGSNGSFSLAERYEVKAGDIMSLDDLSSELCGQTHTDYGHAISATSFIIGDRVDGNLDAAIWYYEPASGRTTGSYPEIISDAAMTAQAQIMQRRSRYP